MLNGWAPPVPSFRLPGPNFHALFKKASIVLLLLLCFGCIEGASTSAKYAPDRLLVRFKTGPPPPSGTISLFGDLGLSPVKMQSVEVSASMTSGDGSPSARVVTLDTNNHRQTQRYKITDGVGVSAKIAQLKRNPDVELAEPDYEVTTFRIPEDPGYNLQWHLFKIGLIPAWDMSVGSKKVKVCVIDTGTRMGHPDLKGNILKGWNVVQSQITDAASKSMFNDTLGHGTHVSGLIAAMGNNNIGVSGVAWKMNLLVCKFISANKDGLVSGYVFDAITCMRLCREEGAHVYSNSWGGVDYHQSLLDEIEEVGAAGGLVVVAAGNMMTDLDSTPTYPASYKAANMMTVAASTQTDGFAYFSNFGKVSVDVAAPGVELLSTAYDGYYVVMSGTSMATPLVAGAAALLQSYAMDVYGKTLTPAKLKHLLMENVDKTPWGPNRVASGGRVNVAKALVALKKELTSPPSPSPPTAPSSSARPPPAPKQQSPPPGSSPLDDVGENSGAILTPPCGTSILKGQPAVQSSTLGSRPLAGNAVDGNCENNPSTKPYICTATDPARSHPWWSTSTPGTSDIMAVSITTRADCCWNTIGGAKIMIGNSAWKGPSSERKFSECGRVPNSGISRGQRMTIKCTKIMTGKYITIVLPKDKTSLVLCEVDVTLARKNAVTYFNPPPIKRRPPPPRIREIH